MVVCKMTAVSLPEKFPSTADATGRSGYVLTVTNHTIAYVPAPLEQSFSINYNGPQKLYALTPPLSAL
jgi:hypothetical protein